MHQSVVPSYLYDPVTYGVSPTTNWWYSSHQKWDVHPPKLCSLLSCYLRYVARERERKIEASCTLGSWHLSSLELSEICGWRVRSGRYLKHQRFWENYSQDRWGCLWTWDGPANSWLFSWGKSGNMVTQWMEWLSPWIFRCPIHGWLTLIASRAMSEIPYADEDQIAIFGVSADVFGGGILGSARMEKQPLV